jgi:hypothetical protein
MLGFVAKKKNQAAVELGRLGGAKKVPKGTAMMSEEKKLEVAMAGVKARAKKAAKKKG